ncbi:response regulator [Streptomyces sp. NPDC020965]|uniref:response regulator transcription factor n=1 Tax=Streptomyces sp. NPDC020965 TaxID=3365105 RepID=UPI00378FA940
MPDDLSHRPGPNRLHQPRVPQHPSQPGSDHDAHPLRSPSPSDPLRVVVADDNPVVRAGLTALLQGRADLDVVAAVADGRAAYEATVRHRPDVVLLDVRMPGVDGISALPHLVRLAPVLMMTYSSESRIVHEALRLGAGGYLVHGEFTADQLLTAVRDIRAGRAAFSHSASGALLAGVRGDPSAGRDGGPLPEGVGTAPLGWGPHSDSQMESSVRGYDDLGQRGVGAPKSRTIVALLPGLARQKSARRSSLSQANMGHSMVGSEVLEGPRAVITGLSQREVEVMDLIASGMTNQQIAASCFISPKTVKNHINRIFAKLNAGSRGEAIAVWHGLAQRGTGR